MSTRPRISDRLPGAEIREGADHFRLLFETMNDAIFIIGADGKFIEVNQVAIDRLGYSREEILQLGPRDINPPDAAERVAETFAKLEREGWATFLTHHVRKDGSRLPVEIYSRRIALGRGQVILSTARDISERIQAKEALAQEADFARSVFNANEDCMAVVDPEGCILDVNESWNRFGNQNGAGPDTAWSIGANYFQPTCAGADGALAGRAYAGIKRVQAGELPSFELEYPCDSPTEARWFSMHVVPVKRRPGVVLISHRNQTAQKSTMNRIQESETQLRTVTEYSHDWEYWQSSNQAIKFISPSCNRITGYSREAFTRDPDLLHLIVHPEDKPLLEAHWNNFLHPGPDRLEFRIIRKDGEVRWIEHVCQPVLDPDGQFDGRRVSNHDITDRKVAENVRAQLAAIVASSSDAVISESLDGKILTWNNAAGLLFGYPAEEAEGCPISMLIPGERRLEEEEILDNIRQGRRVDHFETVRVRKDGTLVDVSITVSPIKDHAGRVVSASKIIQDITARKRAEEVLRTSEEMFNKTFRAAPVLIALSRLKDGTLLDVNERYCLISGFSREEVLGQTEVGLGWVSQEDRERMVGLLVASGRVQDMELTHHRKDGCPVYSLFSGEVIEMAGEAVVVAMAIDITRRRMAELSLTESERKYRLLADNATDVIWLLDLESSRFLYVSPSVERLRGYTPEEVMAQPIEASVTPGSLASIRLEVPKHIHDFKVGAREVYLSEVEQPRKDGSTVWTECATQYSVNRDTGHLVVFGISRDITKRRQTEGALRISEERYRRVAENLAEGLGVTSGAGVYTYCNSRFSEMFGYSQEELLLMTPLDLASAADREMTAKRLKERSEGRADRYEQRLLRKDGSFIDCFLAVSPLMDDAGAYLGSLALITDITEKKGMEAALRRAEKAEALGEMAAGLAHDFNNLFQSLLTHLEMAKTRLDAGTPEGRSVTKASEILLRAALLSQQILQFTGASLRHSRKIPFFSWLNAQEAALAGVLRTTGPFDLELDVPSGDGWVTGDPDQLFSAIKALILNAGEAMAPQMDEGQGPVRISVKPLIDSTGLPEKLYWAEPPGRFPGFCLTVEDNGCGIPTGHEQRIFDPFHSTKAPGRGLGLAAAFGIIRAHGGGIGIGPGLGGKTVAAIYLPYSLTETILPISSAGPGHTFLKPDLPPQAILLADDDPSLLEAMSECLELLGYPVLMARDGIEALGVFKEHRSELALVILDAQMPRMGGVETFRNLRSLDPDLKVILCTGFGEEFGRSTAEEHGFTGFLGKPVRIDQLKMTLEATLLGLPNP